MGGMAAGFITKETFAFLKALARNNDREWFEKNKQRYVDEVRDPLCAFVEAVGAPLRKIHPDVVADPRPNGGSLFRIYRDTRFSKDKTPYKTHAALRFQCGPKGKPSPGFYLGIEPGSVMVAAGIWHPENDVLKRLREAVDDDPKGWSRARKIGLDDVPMLKRPPRGYDEDHPYIEDLKRKSFTTRVPFTEKQACAKDFPTTFVKTCRTFKPLVAFLDTAVR